jgi:hypothetical protein
MFVCAQCGLDPTAMPSRDLSAALVDASSRWRSFVETVLDHPDGGDALATRPSEHVWSGVECAAHVRDVIASTVLQVRAMMATANPECFAFDERDAFDSGYYRALCARGVTDDLVVAAHELAGLLAPLGELDLARTGRANGSVLTIEVQVRTALHESRHHLDDARSATAP